MDAGRGEMPVSVTPYYASLIAGPGGSPALRRSMIPTVDELLRTPEESEDPLGEDDDSPVPGIVHRYPDRVLFLATDTCAANCRYCTRSRIIDGEAHSCGGQLSMAHRWGRAVDYVAATPQIRDVLISGGDPLTLPDAGLDFLLSRLRGIKHVEIIRIGTKVPMVMPQRITWSLVRLLKKYHPLYVSVHCTHPDELTLEARTACTRLADAGIPLGSQTVLLAGINDDADVLARLFHGLLEVRVRPYYLYQCDPIVGSSHFRTPVAAGIEITRALRGHTSGYAVPTFVIDAPGGGGKVPILPDYVIGRDNEHLLLSSYDGNVYRYPDTAR